MSDVARLRLPSEIGQIVDLVERRFAEAAERNAYFNGEIYRADLIAAYQRAASPPWVVERDGVLVGHLYGATSPSPNSPAVWTGPDGYSFTTPEDLRALLTVARRSWLQAGVTTHNVWVPIASGTSAWLAEGYDVVSVRASRAVPQSTIVPTMAFRSATEADFAVAVAFDDFIDIAQGEPPSERSAQQQEEVETIIHELITDPDVNYIFLEIDGVPIGQFVTMEAPRIRGTHEHVSLLSSFAVAPAFRRRGLGRAMVNAALHFAALAGAEYLDVRYRTYNEGGSNFWQSVGFTPVLAQLTTLI